MNKPRIAVIPGSFDPMTLGHLDIIRRASRLYDKIYVAVMINSEKNYMFSIEERKRIAELSCSELENVEVISDGGYLYKLCQRLGAIAIVKGLRNREDFEYEKSMADFNYERNPDCETVFLSCFPGYDGVSSTLVRSFIVSGDFEACEEYVSPKALEYMKKVSNG